MLFQIWVTFLSVLLANGRRVTSIFTLEIEFQEYYVFGNFCKFSTIGIQGVELISLLIISTWIKLDRA